MDIQDALDRLKSKNSIGQEFFDILEEDRALRKDLATYIQKHPDRDIALTLLSKMVELRDKDETAITGETLMLGCYILGLCGQVSDCLVIWNAKSTDFDTFCGIDIQLAVFRGVDETITYLETQTSEEAKEALEYILKCQQAGDFEDLASYYDRKSCRGLFDRKNTSLSLILPTMSRAYRDPHNLSRSLSGS